MGRRNLRCARTTRKSCRGRRRSWAGAASDHKNLKTDATKVQIDRFFKGLLNATDLVWRMGGSRSWELDTRVTHDGQMSVRTPFLDSGQDCWIETTVHGSGVLTFWWKISTYDLSTYGGQSSYAPTNHVQLLEDGLERLGASGDVDWEAHSLPISEGTHTLRWAWVFPDRNAYFSNFNLEWIDQVSFVLGAPQIKSVSLLPDGRLEISVTSTAGAKLGVEASSDLTSWLPIGQLTAPNGNATFIHQTAANYAVHFYRVVVIPP